MNGVFLNADNRQVNAFSLQYVSLILIVLTFLVGALARPRLLASTVPTAVNPQQPAKYRQISRWDSQSFFEHEGTKPNLAEASALSSFLSAHDVFADLRLHSVTASLEQDLLRLENLHRFLEAQAVPPSAYRLFVEVNQAGGESSSPHTLEARFFKFAKEPGFNDDQ